jgi:hypothetical protein
VRTFSIKDFTFFFAFCTSDVPMPMHIRIHVVGAHAVASVTRLRADLADMAPVLHFALLTAWPAHVPVLQQGRYHVVIHVCIPEAQKLTQQTFISFLRVPRSLIRCGWAFGHPSSEQAQRCGTTPETWSGLN